MNIQQATAGNVTLAKLSADGLEHLYLQSSDMLTRAFAVTIRTDEDGERFVLGLTGPGTIAYGTYSLEGSLQHITVEELQTVNTAPFSAKDGVIG